MATSGSWDFSLTAGDVIQAAFEDLAVVEPGVAASTAQIAMARTRLNMISKQWQGDSDKAPGLKIHTRQRVHLFLAKGQQSYTIGPASTDARASTLYGRTTISADEAGGQTVLSITSNTDTTSFPGTTVTMTSADIIGIEMDDGTLFWTTISGTPSTTATVNNALPSQASAGRYVYWFTSRAQKFPLLEAAVLRDKNRVDVPLDIYDEVTEYELGVTNKFQAATPQCLLVEPTRLNTRVTIDAQPVLVTSIIVLTVMYPAEDYDATTDDVAFPVEWTRPLVTELAFALSHNVGRWTPTLEAARKESLEWARALNPEKSVAYYQPDAPL